MKNKWTKTLALLVFYLGFARALGIFWVCQIPAYSSAMVTKILAGKGGYPAQYRILGPWIIGFISRTFHIHMLSAEMLFYWLAFFAAFLAVRYWLRPFVPRAASDLAPVWLAPLIIGNVALRYPCDALTFTVIPLLLALLYRRNWTWLVVVFAVGTLSRETTLLAVIAMAVLALYSKDDRRRLALVGLLCTVIWVAEKYALVKLYGGAVKSVATWKLLQNLRFFTGEEIPVDEPAILGYAVGRFENVYAFMGRTRIFYTYPAYLLSFFGWANFAWVLIFPRWRTKDVFLRRIAWLIPLHIAIMLCVGVIFEKRIFFELYPIVIALGLQTFFKQPRAEHPP